MTFCIIALSAHANPMSQRTEHNPVAVRSQLGFPQKISEWFSIKTLLASSLIDKKSDDVSSTGMQITGQKGSEVECKWKQHPNGIILRH